MKRQIAHNVVPQAIEADVRGPDGDQAREASGQELLSAIVAGEKWAADALYDRLYPSVARSLQRVLQDAGADYEDLVQASFERIMRALLDQRMERVVNLAAWASGIASHVALDALRAKVRERGLFRRDDLAGIALAEVPSAANTERQLGARYQLLAIQGILARMKAELAEAVVLHDMVGHDLAETAALTNVTVPACQSRLFRGRKELLRRLELQKWRDAQ